MADKTAKTKQRRPSKLTSANSKATEPETSPAEENVPPLPPKPHFKRIYLYLHLENIQNLPDTEHEIVLRLEHSKNTITQLVDHYTNSTDINLTKTFMQGEPVPSFSIMIDQDSIEDVNVFSDNPLLLTLYDYIPPYKRRVTLYGDETTELAGETVGEELCEEEEYEEMPEQWIALAQGHLDMLQFFSTYRIYKEVDLLLYPITRLNILLGISTCKSTWTIYSLLPLLKNISFNNLAFISLESLYEVSKEIMGNESQDFVMDFSFQSRIPNEQNEFDKIKIFTFTGFTRSNICDQNTKHKWESLKRDEQYNYNCLGIQTGCQVETFRLFQNLLRTQNADLRFDDINLAEDEVLVCNSLRRYALNDELCSILQEAIAFDQHRLLLEFYRPNQPEKVLLHGFLDLSVFLFPRVNSVRFAVELLSPNAGKDTSKMSKVPEAKRRSLKTSKSTTLRAGENQPRSKETKGTTFAIVSICLLTPLTEITASIANNSNNNMRKDQLNYCSALEPEDTEKNMQQIMTEAYYQYDQYIGGLIDFIVQKDIKSTVEKKEEFCCHLGNLINRMLKIIAFDFNMRFPTDNNIDFTNLMTTVYAELAQRQYRMLQTCANNDLTKCYTFDFKNQLRMMQFISIAKCVFEVGDERLSRHLMKKTPEAQVLTEPEKPKPNFKRIFLYMHLEKICNLPDTDKQLVLRLEQSKNTITQLVDHYTTNTDINLTETYMRGESVPSFSVMIDQDSIEDLNTFSENPLLLTLFMYIPPYKPPTADEEEGGEEEQEEEVQSEQQPITLDQKRGNESRQTLDTDEEDELSEVWIPLAQGHLDMLQFFNTRRVYDDVEIFIYPLSRAQILFQVSACKSTWHLYSLLPLLKEVSFNNLAFIALESLYRLDREIMEDENRDFVVDFSLQSKLPNVNNEFNKTKLCSYGVITKSVISEQNTYQTWESLKRPKINNLSCLGIQTGCKIEFFRLFQNLLQTEGVDFGFDEINLAEEEALVCNSHHRFVLNEELCAILQEVVAFNEQHVLLEFYRRDQPEEILLQGILDLSVFTYPQVNSVRFAVQLRPPAGGEKKQPAKGSTGRAASQKAKTDGPKEKKKKEEAFVIVNICMLTPITETPPSIASNSESHMRKNLLPFCTAMDPEVVAKTTDQIKEEAYQSYEENICAIIDYIVRNQIKSTNQSQPYFCCQMNNLVNKMIKLIAFDFNTRMPTDNNIDFTNLMTTVYAELEQRQYDILQRYNDLQEFVANKTEQQSKSISFLNVAKYMCEIGDETMSKHIVEKIKAENQNDNVLNFYIYIYDMEKLDYEAAKSYPSRLIREKVMEGEYFSQIAVIYVDYVEKLQNEDTREEAYEYLLTRLQIFLSIYPSEIDCWILLYCLYKNSGYLPGMSYTRWKYENLYDKPRKELPPIPKSRWEIYNNSKPAATTMRFTQFYSVMEEFLFLGLYKFADFIFGDIAAECTAPEKYFIMTTLKILQNEVEPKYASRQFPMDRSPQAQLTRAFQCHVNGNLDFYRGNKQGAMSNYAEILNNPNIEDLESFQLGLLRYGQYMLEQREYESAVQAYNKCTSVGNNGMVANIGIGRAMYRLERLKDAEHYFAESTKYKMHIPDVWAFLALVNLKMGNNFQALESWKYAKIHPDSEIGNEIMEELDRIDYSTVDLYVDKPF